MKLRHVAMLTLVGWYLMVLPPVATPKAGNNLVDSEAPFSKWMTIGSYDTTRECNEVWKNTERTRGAVETALPEKSDAFVKGAVEAACCIATDDPRSR